MEPQLEVKTALERAERAERARDVFIRIMLYWRTRADQAEATLRERKQMFAIPNRDGGHLAETATSREGEADA